MVIAKIEQALLDFKFDLFKSVALDLSIDGNPSLQNFHLCDGLYLFDRFYDDYLPLEVLLQPSKVYSISLLCADKDDVIEDSCTVDLGGPDGYGIETFDCKDYGKTWVVFTEESWKWLKQNVILPD